MKMSMNDLLYAISYALDCVEAEILGATTYHSKRVAFMSVRMGKALGMEQKILLNLAAAAVFHDNALKEYGQSGETDGKTPEENTRAMFIDHCVKGEENVSSMPFHRGAENVILYHHEQADGKGPFGKRTDEVPLGARLVHLTDVVDVAFDLNTVDSGKYDRIKRFVCNGKEKMFDTDTVELFEDTITLDDLSRIGGDAIEDLLRDALPDVQVEYSADDLEGISTMIATIIDYKSPFTSNHSMGVANKARTLAEYHGYDRNRCAEVYFAGSLHDIGKLVIKNDVLEKPARLTEDEYHYIQTHAYATWEILRQVPGLGDATHWAALHHEKLDGSGYPFGYKGERLDWIDRMMACVDVYQALREDRPYKPGLSHGEVMEIIRGMSASGKLDTAIVEDIDVCFKES